MAEDYPTLGKVQDVLARIEHRHGVIDSLTDQAITMAEAARGNLLDLGPTGDDGRHG